MMARRYAESTSVSSEASRAEIERTIIRYGADKFGYGWHGSAAVVSFEANCRQVRFVLPLPDKDAEQFNRTPAGRYRKSQDERLKAWEQACRQRWRALALAIKAKLEAVECGITEFEEEFLAHIVMPNGQTVGDYIIPQVAIAYDKREMPKMLPFTECRRNGGAE